MNTQLNEKYILESILDTSVSTQFPNIPPDSLFDLIAFSPAYDPDLTLCRMTIDLGDEVAIDDVVNNISSQHHDDIQIIADTTKNQKLLKFSYKCPGMMKARGLMYQALKNIFGGIVPKQLSFHADTLEILVSPKQTQQICNLFKLCQQLETTRNVKNFQPYSTVDISQMPNDVRSQIASHVSNASASTGNQKSITLVGEFKDLKNAVTTHIGEQYFDIKKCDALEFSKILQQPTMITILTIANGMLDSSRNENISNVIETFRKNKIANIFLKIENQNKEVDKQTLAYQKAIAQGENVEPPTIQKISIESITTLDKLIEANADVFTSTVGIPSPNSVKNPVAKRRLKLFADAVFYGAKCLCNDQWIVAICGNVPSCMVWSRGKPKVYASGPKAEQIIEYANLRDEEIDSLNIPTADKNAYKKIRDDGSNTSSLQNIVGSITIPSTGEVIQYKIISDAGTKSRRIREAAWCTAGAFNGESTFKWRKQTSPSDYWYQYNASDAQQCSQKGSVDNRRPNWVLMNLQDGRLYQYTNGFYAGQTNRFVKKILDETDGSDGYAGAEDMARGMLAAYSKLKGIIDLTDKPNITTSSTNEASKIDLCDDGSILISSPNQVDGVLLYAACASIGSITIQLDDASRLFKNKDISSISKITFRRVKNAKSMFQGALLNKTLTLCSTSSIVLADSMFQNARNCQALAGLNLRNCKSARNCFSGFVGFHNESTQLQTRLALPVCEDVSYMFYGSSFAKIDIQEMDNVKQATSFCQYCPYLTNVPDLRFPKVNSINDLVATYGETAFGQISDDPTTIFAGCDTLFSQIDLEDEARSLLQYYDWKGESVHPQYDERGYILIGSRSDVDVFRKFIPKAPGIMITTSDASQLFANVALNCGFIDMANVKNATKMFENCQISHMRDFMNTDGIVDASEMFSNCRIARFPKLSLKNVVYIDGIFKQIKTMGFPNIELGKHVVTDMRDLTSIFGQQLSSDDDIVVRQSQDRVQNWFNESIKYQVTHAKLNDMLEPLPEDTTKMVLVIDDENDRKTYIENILLCRTTNMFADLHIAKVLVKWHNGERLFTPKFDTTHTIFHDWQNEMPLPQFDLQGVVNAKEMFSDLRYNGNHEITIVNCNNISDCSSMFRKCSFKDLPKLDLPNAKNCNDMFANTQIQNEPTYCILDKIPKCEYCQSMYSYTHNVLPKRFQLTNQLANVINCYGMFQSASTSSGGAPTIVCNEIILPHAVNCNSMFASMLFSSSGPIKIEAPMAEEINSMFIRARFEFGSISTANFKSATSSAYMFCNSTIKQIAMMNVGQCTNASYMFEHSGLRCIGIMKYNVNSRPSSKRMFEDTPAEQSYGRDGGQFFKFQKILNMATR